MMSASVGLCLLLCDDFFEGIGEQRGVAFACKALTPRQSDGAETVAEGAKPEVCAREKR